MTDQAYIFELSEQSFASSAVLNSHKIPVLVEFMGMWSGPCVMMADRLAVLAKEFAGRFVFAKVDVDAQPGLREQYKIENLPTLLVLRGGEVVRTEVGELQEPALRALLKTYGVFRESDELREQARERHLAGDTPGAILLLTQAIRQDPGNTRVALDMVQVFLDMGEVDQAKALFAKLPQRDRDSDMGKAISGQLLFLDLALRTDGMEVLEQRLAADPDDHDARFDLAICQIAVHRQEQGMDHLFQILEQQPGYRGGAARELIATMANMLLPNAPELANEYRRRLANLLAG
jgi:putative thioredoxin